MRGNDSGFVFQAQPAKQSSLDSPGEMSSVRLDFREMDFLSNTLQIIRLGVAGDFFGSFLHRLSKNDYVDLVLKSRYH